MEKNEKNEELQNRREFFKKAAKSAVQELATHSVMAVYTAVTECVLTVVILTVKVVVKVVVWGHAAEVALV